MILKQSNREAEVSDRDWHIVSDLLIKMGHETPKVAPEVMEVKSLDNLLPELSAWGIPWKRTRWN